MNLCPLQHPFRDEHACVKVPPTNTDLRPSYTKKGFASNKGDRYMIAGRSILVSCNNNLSYFWLPQVALCMIAFYQQSLETVLEINRMQALKQF